MPKAKRLSAAQREALIGLAEGRIGREWNGVEWSYIPYLPQERTYDALERHGLIRWQPFGGSVRINGYVITDAGRVAIGDEVKP